MNEVTYKRELNHSYLVQKCLQPALFGGYAWRMMEENRIGRLLDCRPRFLDGETWLYYDISSRQPLERLYESAKMGLEDLARILRSIAAMQEDLGEYLLDEQGLVLEAEMLFADVETEELFFCFDPGRKEEEYRYANLADFFLEHVDHGDERAVNVAYQFYKLSKGAYFVLSSFLPYLEKEEARAREAAEGLEREADPFAPSFAQDREQGEGRDCGDPAAADRFLETEEEGEKAPRKKGLFSRLFSGMRKKRGKEREEKPLEEPWPDTVWDSYAGQLDPKGTGETVYFTDLERGTEKEKPAWLEEEGGSRRFPLDQLPMTVGKLKGRVSIELTDSSVSRIHARLQESEGGIRVLDLNSRNGTIVNGKKLSPNESAALREGDVIQFGRERFALRFYSRGR